MQRSPIIGGPTRRRGVGFLAIGFVFMVALCGALDPAPGHALSLDIDGVTGELRGASGVDVDGTLYNVTFRDGTCEDLFHGCNATEDFPFSAPIALLAAQALLDQVFLDFDIAKQFDTQPALTRGCETPNTCIAVIPQEIVAVGVYRRTEAENHSAAALDKTAIGCCIAAQYDTFNDNFLVWAVWSPQPTGGVVPEPGTLLFLATGLLGLAGARWRQRRAEGQQVG